MALKGNHVRKTSLALGVAALTALVPNLLPPIIQWAGALVSVALIVWGLAPTLAVQGDRSSDYPIFHSAAGSETGSAMVLQPKLGWLPLPEAMFRLFEMAPRDRDVEFFSKWILDAMLAGGTIGEPSRYPGAQENLARPDMRTLNGQEFVECKVAWDNRTFHYGWAFEPSPGDWRTSGVDAPPWRIAKRFFPALSDETFAQLSDRSATVWMLIQEPIDHLIAMGVINVWARYGSPFAPFQKLPPDGWRHYTVTDWDNGRADASSNDILYSVHLELCA